MKKLDDLFKSKINIFSDTNCQVISKTIDFKELKTDQKKKIITNMNNSSIFIDENSFVCLSKLKKEKVYNLTNVILLKEGNEKFIESNVGQTLKKADALFAQAGAQGSRTPEQQAAFTQGTAIMANAPRLMAGWVLASDVPGGKMLYNKDLANKRQVEIELFTATDDMNMRQILDESKPAGENYGTLLQKIKAVKKDYFAQRTPQYQDSELGKAVQANT